MCVYVYVAGNCTQPTAPVNGTVTQCGSGCALDVNITYDCDPWFYVNGSAQVQCLAGDVWSYPPPVCSG